MPERGYLGRFQSLSTSAESKLVCGPVKVLEVANLPRRGVSGLAAARLFSATTSSTNTPRSARMDRLATTLPLPFLPARSKVPCRWLTLTLKLSRRLKPTLRLV